VLFRGTIRDNLTLWDTTLPDARLADAARSARINDVIDSRPGGFDSEVADGGTNFSGGHVRETTMWEQAPRGSFREWCQS
jgi:ABC-type multidrug transport system fused ATPase/permease subunit